MGLFSKKPPPPLPARADLDRALAGLATKDADEIRSKKMLAQMCVEIPADEELLAVLHVFIDSPGDHGLLWVSRTRVVFVGGHSGVTILPIAAVRGAEVPFNGTLRVLYDPTVTGINITFKHEQIARAVGDPEGLDFTVTCQPASQEYFCTKVRSVT